MCTARQRVSLTITGPGPSFGFIVRVQVLWDMGPGKDGKMSALGPGVGMRSRVTLKLVAVRSVRSVAPGSNEND